MTRFSILRGFAVAAALTGLATFMGCSGGGGGGGGNGSNCSNTCLNAGITQCSGSQVQTCAQASNGCLAWGSATACPAGQFCASAQNACVACPTACPQNGATQCSGAQVETCALDSNGCLVWGAATACPGGNGTEFCDPAQQKCASCVNTCPQAGATQCSGAQVETCTANTQGCLAWSVATSCPTGQTCDSDQNKCVDICSTSAVQSACGSAAVQVSQCCAGGIPAMTAAQLCQLAQQAGKDPQAYCSAISTDSCSTLHQGAMTGSTPNCCCPSGQFCDLSTSTWACVPACTSAANCGGSAPACVPDTDQNGTIQSKAMICKTNYKAPYYGCNSGSGVCCSNPYDCVQDSNGNEYCAQPCGGSTTCAGAATCKAIAACANCLGSCSSSYYCMP